MVSIKLLSLNKDIDSNSRTSLIDDSMSCALTSTFQRCLLASIQKALVNSKIVNGDSSFPVKEIHEYLDSSLASCLTLLPALVEYVDYDHKVTVASSLMATDNGEQMEIQNHNQSESKNVADGRESNSSIGIEKLRSYWQQLCIAYSKF